MSTNEPGTKEFLVISRGQWDPARTPEEVQNAIDRFYVWHAEHVEAGRMRRGQRLAPQRRIVTRAAIVTDGPFAETKEVIGGYWFVIAESLDEAAQISAGNPCLECGLSFEIRPIEPVRASAYATTTETPVRPV